MLGLSSIFLHVFCNSTKTTTNRSIADYWTCRASAIYDLPINLQYIRKRVPALLGSHPILVNHQCSGEKDPVRTNQAWPTTLNYSQERLHVLARWWSRYLDWWQYNNKTTILLFIYSHLLSALKFQSSRESVSHQEVNTLLCRRVGAWSNSWPPVVSPWRWY